MKAPKENNDAALIPRPLMNPRKKLFVPKKTPAKKLGKIRNLRGFSLSDSAGTPSSLYVAYLTLVVSKMSPPLSPMELERFLSISYALDMSIYRLSASQRLHSEFSRDPALSVYS